MQQQGVQSMMMGNEMAQQQQQLALQGDETISQALAAKQAGVPEASLALQQMAQMMAAPQPGPPGAGGQPQGGGKPQQQLMQSALDQYHSKKRRLVESARGGIRPARIPKSKRRRMIIAMAEEFDE
jgi:hypothetical protein